MRGICVASACTAARSQHREVAARLRRRGLGLLGRDLGRDLRRRRPAGAETALLVVAVMRFRRRPVRYRPLFLAAEQRAAEPRTARE